MRTLRDYLKLNFFNFLKFSFLTKLRVEITFWTLSFFWDENEKGFFSVGRVENGTGVYIGDL